MVAFRCKRRWYGGSTLIRYEGLGNLLNLLNWRMRCRWHPHRLVRYGMWMLVVLGALVWRHLLRR